MLNNQTGLKRLIFAHAAAGGELPPINEYTVTGNRAEFNTNLAQSLLSFEIPFSPVQSGSGDPSPSNIRPISGWAGVTINANGNLIMVEWQSVTGIVYGGTLDAVTGVLTVDCAIRTVSGADIEPVFYTRSDGSVRFISSTSQITAEYGSGKQSAICASNMKTHPNGASSTTSIVPSIGIGASNASPYIVLPSEYGVTNLEEAAEWLDNNSFQFAYKMRYPQTIQLSPVEVRTIIGQNSIGTNTNGTNTIKYLKRG